MLASSAEQGTSQHLLVAFSTVRRAPESSPGPALFSTRTTTSSAAVLSFPTTAATTMDEAQGRLSQLLTSSRMSSRTSKSQKRQFFEVTNIFLLRLLKIRVGEYDASGFNPPETAQHEEYTIVRLLKHPQFSAGRLSNDIAILYTDRDINLNKPNVNTACLPSCRDQFGHQFNNGTGLRCWWL